VSRDAERAIRDLNERASAGGLEAIGALLLRSEAVASSKIEGYQVSTLNLARRSRIRAPLPEAPERIAGRPRASRVRLRRGARSAAHLSS